MKTLAHGVKQLSRVLQCQGCQDYILGMVVRYEHRFDYMRHHPIGQANDKVAIEIPPEIGKDFKEALRCRWVDAYNATVEMCRRALQSSCDDLNATGNNLLLQIDDLASRGVITAPLKELAHKVRLGGNRGAHPSTGTAIGEEEADAVITFTKHYFEHVYVMPASLARFNFSKSIPPGKAAT